MENDDTAHGFDTMASKDVNAVPVKDVEWDGGLQEASVRSGKSYKSQESITQSHVGQGTWLEAGYHLATTISTPAAYAPIAWAFAQLTWPGGILTFLAGWMVTFYNSILLSSIHTHDGNRYTRYSDLSESILGKPGRYGTIIFQQIASLGNNITIQIAAGTSLKAMYIQYNPDGNITLQEWIIIFGCIEYVLSQLPNIHSLRLLNTFSTVCTMIFAISVTAGSIYNGYNQDRSQVSFDLSDGAVNQMMNAWSAIGTIAFVFGDTVLPEVQACVKDPCIKNMYKGVTLCFSVILITSITVGVSGYWAFGNAANPWLVLNFVGPGWLVTLANLTAVLQIVGCYQIYTRPTYEWLEIHLADHTKPPISIRNCASRAVITAVYCAVLTTICCMIPFFGNFVSLVGALGFTPLDFVLPVVLYLMVRKTSWWFKAFNCCIVLIYIGVAITGAVGSLYFVAQQIDTYSLFANL